MALSAREKVQEVFRLLRSTVPSICLQGLIDLKKNLDKSESASVFIEQGVLEVLYNVSKSDRKVIVDYCLSCLGHITSSPRHVFLNVSVDHLIFIFILLPYFNTYSKIF